MSNARMPWSIKGLGAEARAAATEAARSAGEPVGIWLARVIREAAAAEARERSEAGGTAPPD